MSVVGSARRRTVASDWRADSYTSYGSNEFAAEGLESSKCSRANSKNRKGTRSPRDSITRVAYKWFVAKEEIISSRNSWKSAAKLLRESRGALAGLLRSGGWHREQARAFPGEEAILAAAR